ncbi:unnamed protein product [Callosobruchus maculatus]|uniref:Uncharacterized protein n=1 Tax=Callosobruchus maculatus TaxID=64391 RepID=A0A653DWL4_CALMS|nr:unnamed protein product [Callosobruchus maculatus]
MVMNLCYDDMNKPDRFLELRLGVITCAVCFCFFFSGVIGASTTSVPFSFGVSTIITSPSSSPKDATN